MAERTCSLRTRSPTKGRPTPLVLLYHCNSGFPIVSPVSQLTLDDARLEPRDTVAAQGLVQHVQFDPPSAGYQKQVFFHTPKVDPQGCVAAILFNPELRLRIQLRWRAGTLPIVTQWKRMDRKEYACGLESATHVMGPRKALAEKGLPQVLAPVETRRYALQLRIVDHI